MRMVRGVTRLVVALATACGVLWLLGIGLARVAQWNRKLLIRLSKPYNAVILKMAGGPFSPYAVLQHTGRRSGRVYRTPLGAFPWRDGFVLALAYGRDVDWCRNVLAAGRCTLRWQGQEYALERPEIMPIAHVWGAFDLPAKLSLRAAGITECVWLHRQREAPAPVPGTERAQAATQ